MLFSPGTVVANDLPAPADKTPAPEITKTPEPANPGSSPPLDTKALMDAINADREARDARAKTDADAASFKQKYEEAQAKLADIEKGKRNRTLDPAGYLRKLGYTDKELALTAEGIMFSLMPEKAPVGHLANLVKAQREQDEEARLDREKAQATEATRREAEAKTATERDIEARYRFSLKGQVAAMPAGTAPAAQAWYADDHDGFTQELFETAQKLAEEAVKAGKVIDVSALAIAQHLEKTKYAPRLARWGALSPKSPTTTQPQSQSSTEKTEPSKPEEKTNLVKGGPNHRLTEKEIIDRATKAAFGLA